MTVLAAIHLRGRGCVIAGDGRVTADDRIHSDAEVKVLRTRGMLVGVCGDLHALQRIMVAEPETPADLVASVRGMPPGSDVGCLVYLIPDDTLWHYAADGSAIRVPRWTATGSGEGLALGYLEALAGSADGPSTAEAVARGAAKAACRHVSSCGGRVRLVRHWR